MLEHWQSNLKIPEGKKSAQAFGLDARPRIKEGLEGAKEGSLPISFEKLK